MALEPIGINLTVFQNITLPDLSINTTLNTLLPQTYEIANTGTNHLLTFIILMTITIITFFLMSDQLPFGDFGYNNIRALGISLGTSSTLGVLLVMIGVLSNYKSVVFFVIMFMILNIYLAITENKE